MPGRSFSSSDYRYGFIGQENDNEVNGVTGSSQDHKFRSYDTRLGRYKSLDPLSRDYPWNSPYAYAENDVIRSIDLEGREKYVIIGEASNIVANPKLVFVKWSQLFPGEEHGPQGNGIQYMRRNYQDNNTVRPVGYRDIPESTQKKLGEIDYTGDGKFKNQELFDIVSAEISDILSDIFGWGLTDENYTIENPDYANNSSEIPDNPNKSPLPDNGQNNNAETPPDSIWMGLDEGPEPQEDGDPRKSQKQRLSDKLYKDLQHELVFEEGEIGKTKDDINYKRSLPDFEIEYSGDGIIHYSNNENETFSMSTKEGKNKPKLSFSTSEEIKDLANQAFESSNNLKRLDFVLSKIQPDWNNNAKSNLDENGTYQFTENSFMISIASKRKGRIQKVKKGIGGY